MADYEVIATGEEPVRQFLRRLAMPEPDISHCLDEARKGSGPATVSFSSDDEGLIPQLTLAYNDPEFVLTEISSRSESRK